MPHRPALTDRILGYRAFQVWAHVQQCVANDGLAPTYTGIMAEIGIGSKGEVSRIVSSLERRGLLSRTGSGRVRRISIGRAHAKR